MALLHFHNHIRFIFNFNSKNRILFSFLGSRHQYLRRPDHQLEPLVAFPLQQQKYELKRLSTKTPQYRWHCFFRIHQDEYVCFVLFYVSKRMSIWTHTIFWRYLLFSSSRFLMILMSSFMLSSPIQTIYRTFGQYGYQADIRHPDNGS